MPAQVCFVVGARPNFMKTAPVIRALHQQDAALTTLLIHTGQHYDKEMSDVFLHELDLPRPDVFLEVGSGTHGEQTARALERVEDVLLRERPNLVVVPGDVNSTLAAALAAAKVHIPVAHLEAGLRSFDRSMPEEHNRRLTDHLSSLLLVHSESAVTNLEDEGIDPALVRFVGNTMIDSLFAHLDQARALRPWLDYGVEPGGYGLVTLHRPALTDDVGLLGEAMSALIELSSSWPIVFPAHPRTQLQIDRLGLREALERSRVTLTPPLGYLPFLGLEADARFVLTDSGGIQEETSALGVPCFTLRDTTERPVTVELGTNRVVGTDPARIVREAEEALAGGSGAEPPRVPPLWEGKAAGRILDALVNAG